MQSPLVSTTLFLSVILFINLSFLDAFNITQILSGHPEFSTFNSYLTDNQLVPEINGRQTITVLAVDNSVLGKVSGTPQEAVKKILSIHVLLDYYDPPKLKSMPAGPTLVTTLFQTTGLATNQQGFVNISVTPSGDVKFGSATPGSDMNAALVKSITSEPFNISVLQISDAIVPSGIASSATSPASGSPTPSPASPAKSPTLMPPVPGTNAPRAAPPVPSTNAPTPSTRIPPSAAPTLAPGAGSAANAPASSPADAGSAAAPTLSPGGAGSSANAPTLSPASGSAANAPSMSDSPSGSSPSLSPAGEAPAEDGAPDYNRTNSAMTNAAFNILAGCIAVISTLSVLLRP